MAARGGNGHSKKYMTFYDDNSFLLSYLRHSAVVSDETGMSELLFASDIDPNDESKSYFSYKSLGMKMDSQIGIVPVVRSSLINYESVAEFRRGRSQLKPTISPSPITPTFDSGQAEQIAELEFPQMPIVPNSEKPHSSVLSNLLSNTDQSSLSNPFTEFQKFSMKSGSSKQLHIFIGIEEDPVGTEPMTINVDTNARVFDIIGLICWQYTVDGREPELEDDPAQYELMIAEEDGEMEELPPLNKRDAISKFDFPYLALVVDENYHKSEKTVIQQSVKVTFLFDSQTYIINVDGPMTPLKTVYEKCLSIRLAGNPNLDCDYILELKDNFSHVLSMNSMVGDYAGKDFVFYKKFSSRFQMSSGNASVEDWIDKTVSCFNVTGLSYFIRRLIKQGPYQLRISKAKLEMEPLFRKQSLLSRSPQMPITQEFKMEDIIDCEIFNKKSNGIYQFRIIIFQPQSNQEDIIDDDFFPMEFECESILAIEIVKLLRANMDSHPSNQRFMYEAEMRFKRRSLRKSILHF